MESNNIRPSSPTPSSTSADSGIEVDSPTTGSAFNRSAKPVAPELNQQDLEPAQTPTTRISDRVPSDLSAGQKLKLGLLRLGAALLSGTRANHWLADKALGLLKSSYVSDQRSVAVKLQDMIETQQIHLDEKQSETYATVCQNFAKRDEVDGEGFADALDSSPPPPPLLTPEILADKRAQLNLDKSRSFMENIYSLYNDGRSEEALAAMSPELFRKVSHKALENPIKSMTIKLMAEKEEIEPDLIAGTFNDVAYDVVASWQPHNGKPSQQPQASPDLLAQLRVMVKSMQTLYPKASNYDRTLEEIDKQIGKAPE